MITTSVGDLGTKILATNNFWDFSLTFALAAGPLYGFPSCFIRKAPTIKKTLNTSPVMYIEAIISYGR